MKLVSDRASLCLIFILITCCNMFFGWQTSISIRSRIGIMKRMLTVSDPPEEYEWGTSFIGQDVCGSKLNDDPFGEQGNKPSAWEIMKKKIEALELRDKLAAEEEARLIADGKNGTAKATASTD